MTLNGLLLPIRRRFDQYVCERPSVLYPGIRSPLADKEAWDIDIAVIQGEHRGRVRQRRRVPVQRVPRRGRNTDERLHAARV